MTGTSQRADFDSTRAEAFSGRFLTALNDGALCLMASVGHRTGLFDVMRELPPAASEEIAAKAGLNERYVREWLGAMVTAGVVEVDPETVRYRAGFGSIEAHQLAHDISNNWYVVRK